MWENVKQFLSFPSTKKCKVQLLSIVMYTKYKRQIIMTLIPFITWDLKRRWTIRYSSAQYFRDYKRDVIIITSLYNKHNVAWVFYFCMHLTLRPQLYIHKHKTHYVITGIILILFLRNGFMWLLENYIEALKGIRKANLFKRSTNSR